MGVGQVQQAYGPKHDSHCNPEGAGWQLLNDLPGITSGGGVVEDVKEGGVSSHPCL